MSLAEIKHEISRLSQGERQQLFSYLAEVTERDDPAYYADMDRRMKAMDAGDRVSMEALRAKHEELVKRGR